MDWASSSEVELRNTRHCQRVTGARSIISSMMCSARSAVCPCDLCYAASSSFTTQRLTVPCEMRVSLA
jgi:hypothetical protein